jgi:hypothetical protein
VDKKNVLKVGSIDLVVPQIGNELLAIFHEDMTYIRRVPAREYWPGRWPGLDQRDDEPLVPVKEFRAPGGVLSERLELMGFNEGLAFARMDGIFAADRSLTDLGIIESEEATLAGSLNSRAWVERIRSSTEGIPGPSLDSRGWLLEQVSGLGLLWRLRVILLAFPEAEVVLDVTETDLSHSEVLPAWGGLDAAEELNYKATAYAPIIVLTEGKTDAEFLKAALSILYPYLTDLIRFLDYGRKPEGGAAALVHNIRAFAAAGIVNRIVAVFDNDTAAADALRRVDISSFAPGIQILHYPNLELAENYPTIEPPTSNAPPSLISPTNINGLAGSVEVYLGRDVLTQEDGSLQPIQLTSFIHGMQAYQGEITNKTEIQRRFRAKYKLAQEHPETVKYSDWSGLRLIIDAIRNAARDALLGSECAD